MKTAVISGASGFLGGALAKKLLESGCTVYGLGRSFEKRSDITSCPGFIPVEVEFEKYRSLDQYISERGFDVFYHFAWQGGFERNTLKDYVLQLENARYACDAVTAAVRLRARKFVYAGTINEIEIQQFLNRFSDFQSRPTCIYAAAKLVAELICRTITQEEGLHYSAGLIPMPYGKGNHSRQLVNVVLGSLMRGESPKLTEGRNLYDLVSVQDIAAAFEAIGESGRDGMRYYIGHRQLKTFREWMQQIGQIVAPEVPLRFGEYDDPLDLDYSLIDLDALYHDTGFECQADFEESIRKTVQWLMEENMRSNEKIEDLVNNPSRGGAT